MISTTLFSDNFKALAPIYSIALFYLLLYKTQAKIGQRSIQRFNNVLESPHDKSKFVLSILFEVVQMMKMSFQTIDIFR